MGTSSLLGTDAAVADEAAGRDLTSLGPSDSSDSGSDLIGVAEHDEDPGTPVDVALREDVPHPLRPDALHGAVSDAAGTGERRSAGADAPSREASDIGVDRVVTPARAAGPGDDEDDDDDDDDAPLDDDEVQLARIERAQAADPLEDEDETSEPGTDALNEHDGIPGARTDDEPRARDRSTTGATTTKKRRAVG